jgi:pimeloyl-ACP methyl ester carboxylesterase
VIAGAGPAILFLHGFPGWWYTWAGVMDVLRERYLVVAIDLPGHGGSPAPGDTAEYALPRLLAGVGRCLDAACAHPRADGLQAPLLVGHDWGAVIGWALAETTPERVGGLVTIGMPHPRRLREAIAIDPLQRMALAYVERLMAGEVPFTAEEAVEWIVPASEPEEREVHLAALRSVSAESVISYYRENAVPHRLPVPRSAPTLPVLQLHGLEDRFCLPSSFRAPPLENARTTTVGIPDGGHFVHVEQPQRVAAEIAEWGGRRARG